MELRIGDRAALHAHALPAEGAVCRQQLLVTLAVDHVLARIQDPETSPRLTIGRCFTVTVGRTACAWAAVVIAIGANIAAATAKISAAFMIITLAPPGCSRRKATQQFLEHRG